MKKWLIWATALAVLPAYGTSEYQTADVGFRGTNYHIAIDLGTSGGQATYRFASRDVTGRAAPMSECAYTEATLIANFNQTQDAAVRADSNWILMRSGFASSSIEQFYPAFKAVLERANPRCSVKPLQTLLQELTTRAG